MDWLYAVVQCAVMAMACLYWSCAVTDLFSRYMRHLGRTRPAPAPVTHCANNLPRMIRINGKVVYRPADQKSQQGRNRGGVLFRW
jgi:hypothetical protein